MLFIYVIRTVSIFRTIFTIIFTTTKTLKSTWMNPRCEMILCFQKCIKLSDTVSRFGLYKRSTDTTFVNTMFYYLIKVPTFIDYISTLNYFKLYLYNNFGKFLSKVQQFKRLFRSFRSYTFYSQRIKRSLAFL